ncbi:MAG: flagellar biosynthesis protein FliQ [Candidatus Competibacteraceae bacterium]|nr:flagellar biosynthesis protein FliQ [Candidatus Competibacteraceae bacterium]MBK7985194.1 flagellar biosynthesis protein FliQ [Candidatus Competibacteraceae bacterium]MBK8895731.1 flagellar biosynthesis protein FliQ [Candidatus Competibacteraceae bacterium]MBK8962823.1 flagellar biosynthesis protein FliQ [Candidatus Competibacteraceae bacterium]MBK9953244.1 flagellar biosynthesis protein FliQ [Candidatus Competibacteraceae bacterium]
MTPETIMTLGQRALELAVLVSAPLLLSALVIGVLISLFQAATQINEMTLSFVPKLLVLVVVLLLAGPWMLELLVDFTRTLFKDIPHLIG